MQGPCSINAVLHVARLDARRRAQLVPQPVSHIAQDIEIPAPGPQGGRKFCIVRTRRKRSRAGPVVVGERRGHQHIAAPSRRRVHQQGPAPGAVGAATGAPGALQLQGLPQAALQGPPQRPNRPLRLGLAHQEQPAPAIALLIISHARPPNHHGRLVEHGRVPLGAVLAVLAPVFPVGIASDVHREQVAAVAAGPSHHGHIRHGRPDKLDQSLCGASQGAKQGKHLLPVHLCETGALELERQLARPRRVLGHADAQQVVVVAAQGGDDGHGAAKQPDVSLAWRRIARRGRVEDPAVALGRPLAVRRDGNDAARDGRAEPRRLPDGLLDGPADASAAPVQVGDAAGQHARHDGLASAAAVKI